MAVYPSITTTKGDWREKIAEAKKLNLTEVCFFPTVLSQAERAEAYQLLERTKIFHIPLVHLKNDMIADEIKYFQTKFKTKFFNIHSENSEHKFSYDLSDYAEFIYIENQRVEFSEAELKKYAGICLDVSHLANQQLGNDKIHDYFVNLLGKYPCGCAHISAIIKKSGIFFGLRSYSRHVFKNLTEFDYLLDYKKFLPEVLALEVENSIVEQIEAQKYISNLLKSG